MLNNEITHVEEEFDVVFFKHLENVMVTSKANKMVQCFCSARYDIGFHWVLMINSLNLKSKVVVRFFAHWTLLTTIVVRIIYQ
jgi:hypothetical protein